MNRTEKKILRPDPALPVDALEVLWTEEITDKNKAELAAAQKLMEDHDKSDAAGRKLWLLQLLEQPNRYLRGYVESQILILDVKEAIPILRPRLASGSEEERLSAAGSLRCLGDEQAYFQVVQWLNQGRWTEQWELINELASWRRKEAIPVIRPYADSQDALLAVKARIALYRLEVEGARAMLFDSLKLANPFNVRYNAIHTLEYSTDDFSKFTPEEVAHLKALTQDGDESVRRQAKNVLELALKKYIRQKPNN